MAVHVNPEDDWEDITCAICSLIPLEPVVETHCNQVFCEKCIWNPHSDREEAIFCPVCCHRITRDDIGALRDELPYEYQIWKKISVKCDYHEEGCDWTGPLSTYHSHVLSCPKNIPTRLGYCEKTELASLRNRTEGMQESLQKSLNELHYLEDLEKRLEQENQELELLLDRIRTHGKVEGNALERIGTQQQQQQQQQVIVTNPVQTYTEYYHSWTAQAKEEEKRAINSPVGSSQKVESQRMADWAKHYADQSSRVAHHFYQNPNATYCPFDLPPAPPDPPYEAHTSSCPTKNQTRGGCERTELNSLRYKIKIMEDKMENLRTELRLARIGIKNWETENDVLKEIIEEEQTNAKGRQKKRVKVR